MRKQYSFYLSYAIILIIITHYGTHFYHSYSYFSFFSDFYRPIIPFPPDFVSYNTVVTLMCLMSFTYDVKL